MLAPARPLMMVFTVIEHSFHKRCPYLSKEISDQAKSSFATITE